MAKNVLAKAWRFSAHGGTFSNVLKLEELMLKKATGDVVLRMQAAPITTADLDQVRGLHGKVPLPATAGLSGVGVVTEAAGNLKEGDHAVLAGATGSWSSYVVASASHVIRVPSNIPIEYASLLAAGPMAAYRILKASGLKAGDLLVLSGANTPIGLATLQLAKAWGINAVGIAAGAVPLQVEKLKQMGLPVVADYSFDADQVFGSSRPKLALSLVGGLDSAYLAHLLAPEGRIVVCPNASDEPHIIPSADLMSKNLHLQTFSLAKSLSTASSSDTEAMVAELGDLITGHQLKANAIIRHEFANLFDAIAEAGRGIHNVVLMHQGTEKTWSNKPHDLYMAVDEQLQRNWDAAGATQDPYLKLGREQPWELLAEPSGLDASALPAELKAKFAAVTTEEELMAVVQSLTFWERHVLGLPGLEAVTLTAEELKKAVRELGK